MSEPTQWALEQAREFIGCTPTYCSFEPGTCEGCQDAARFADAARLAGALAMREAHEKTLRYIIAQCGIADPVEACRQIIATCERAIRSTEPEDTRSCTCPPDERPTICPRKFALSECLAADTTATPSLAKDKTAINKRVKARYDELMAEGKHGHYETMFHVVHEERERCAEEADKWRDPHHTLDATIAATAIATAIRSAAPEDKS